MEDQYNQRHRGLFKYVDDLCIFSSGGEGVSGEEKITYVRERALDGGRG